MLRKKTNGVAKGPRAGSLLSSLAAKTMDRRGFLAASGSCSQKVRVYPLLGWLHGRG